MATDAFRVYSTDHPNLPVTIGRRLEVERQRQLNDLRVSQTWETFKERCGIIAGIELAIQICSEAEKEQSR